jgi:hypothetical protein
MKDTKMNSNSNSNSKLTPYQKAELVEFKTSNPDVVFVDNVGFAAYQLTTIGYIDDGKIVRFATSIMSDGEQKFRRKVGQYNVALRIDADNTAILPSFIFTAFLEDNGFMSKADRNNRKFYPD